VAIAETANTGFRPGGALEKPHIFFVENTPLVYKTAIDNQRYSYSDCSIKKRNEQPSQKGGP
jgi:hypothetical protein